MKTYLYPLLASLCLPLYAASPASQTTTTPIQTPPAPTPYAVTQKDANSSVWQRTVYETGPSGQVVSKTHSYTELATGLHYQQNGQWLDSKEEIDILPNGTAAATQGQHQAYFPGDIYTGQIELVTPDGQQLHSRPLELSYFDGTNIAMIAELTNSIGQVLGDNQVIYTNAFSGLNADLVYTYKKSGFEQDVVLRQQPPTPESLGLNPDTARLQVLTEFFAPPQPTVRSTAMPVQAGLALTDESLGFGTMQMVPGRAFLLGRNAADAGARVGKQWVVLEGRQFLVEEVPVDAIAEGLAALPLTALNAGSSRHSHTAARHLKLPPRRLAKNNTSKTMLMARTESRPQGFVLDYLAINSSLTNFTFQGDMTYYLSGTVNLSGTNTFEGGTVLKYASNASLIVNGGQLNWQAGMYRPAVFTAIDDNSVGETISGSTGSPSGYYANPALSISSVTVTSTIANFRISWASLAISVGSSYLANFYNGQLVNCGEGIGAGFGSVNLRNMLFANVQTNLGFNYDTIDAQNVTFSGSACLASDINYGNLTLENCILANVASLTNEMIYGSISGNNNGFYNSPNFGSAPVTGSAYPFQTVGAGSYYLTNGCSFLNAGTTNIDPVLLADIRTKTTYPPIAYSQITITTNLVLVPQAPRDTNAAPDLGYHYDPIDYAFGGSDLFTNLTITAGTVFGWYQDFGSVYSSGEPYGLSLNDGANFTSTGTATRPCWIVQTATVQEGYNGNWSLGGWMGAFMLNGSGSGVLPQINGKFTKWSAPTTYNHFRDNWDHGVGSFMNCEFYNGGIGSYLPSLYFTNCLFSRVATVFWSQVNAASFTYQNCTFYNGFIAMVRNAGQSYSFWTVKNTMFDGTGFLWVDNFNGSTNYTYFDYNAYNTNNNSSWVTYPSGYWSDPTLETIGAHDVIITNAFAWQASWLGNFYQPTNSMLINAGSPTADQVGLYDFTTQSSQVHEGNSIVDIGYHYAVDTTDSNGDGMADVWEMYYFGTLSVDPNGNPAGDGLTNLQKYQAGLNPNVDYSTQSGSRLNYLYDAGGWLQTVSGVHNGSVSPDSEGNIQTVSQ